jgi:hypothetical protein
MADTITITVLKWDEYNGRKDVKYPRWFRLEYHLVEDPDFFNFTHEEFKAWIYILSQACRKNRPTISINYDHAKATARLSRNGINGCIKKLLELQEPPVSVTDANVSVTDANVSVTDALRDRTGQDSTEQDKNYVVDFASRKINDIDFDAIYQKYPRKEGKTKGIAQCAAQIKTSEDYEKLSRAVDKYAHLCKGKDKKFIKLFSTFMGSKKTPTWMDYLDKDVGISTANEVDWEWVGRED